MGGIVLGRWEKTSLPTHSVPQATPSMDWADEALGPEEPGKQVADPTTPTKPQNNSSTCAELSGTKTETRNERNEKEKRAKRGSRRRTRRDRFADQERFSHDILSCSGWF